MTASHIVQPAAPRTRSPLRVAVFGCDRHETALVRSVAPLFGVRPLITEAPASAATVEAARGHRCISVDHKTPIAAGTLRALKEAGVAYISTRSIGLDHIDLVAARQLGITVENVSYSPYGVADFTLMLILMAVRGMKSTLLRVEAGDYRLKPQRSKELSDLTVGVVGTGRIGAAVLERLRGFGCRIVAHDRRPRTGYAYLPLDELLSTSDIVTLHTPLTAATHHLIDRHRVDRMKPGAYLINTGRGPLIDSYALADAIDEGRLGGAALDVLEGEEDFFYADAKQIDNELLRRLTRLPNVIISPHIAYYTDHAAQDMVENSIINCLRFENGEPSWIS